MDGAAWAFVGVVIGGLLTGATTLGVEWVKARGDARLDRHKRSDDRRLSRDTFERETMLALQEGIGAITDLIPWLTETAIEVDVFNRWRVADFRVIAMRSRVGDPELRAATAGLLESVGNLVAAKSAEEKSASFAAAGLQAHTALERSGDLMRRTFRVAEDKS